MNKQTAIRCLAASFVLILCTQAIAVIFDRSLPGSPAKYWTDATVVRLANAITNSDLQAIDDLVKHGADVNALGRGNSSPLLWAIARQNKAAFQRLLEHGADPSLPYFDAGHSIMYWLGRNEEDAAWLAIALKAGADPDEKQGAAMFGAINSRRKDNLMLLIEAGADLNCRDNIADTPTLFAAGRNWFDTVHYLLEAGADTSARCIGGRDLAYEVVRHSARDGSEIDEWRERVVERLADQGTDFADAHADVARWEFSDQSARRWCAEERRRWRRWATLTPGNARELRLRAVARIGLENYDGAIADASRAATLEPANAASFIIRARARSRLAAARRDATSAGTLTLALADDTTAMRLAPKTAGTLVARAAVHSLLQKPADAVADLSEAIAIDPENARTYWRRAEARLMLAAASGTNEGLQEALADCDKSISLSRKDHHAYRVRGNIRAKLGDDARAMADYDDAIGYNPRYADAYADRARAWLAKGDERRAQADLAAAGDYRNRYADLIFAGEFGKVIDVLATAAKTEKESPRACRELAEILSQCPDAKWRDPDKALQFAKKGCELTQWKSADHLATLASSFAVSGKLDEAIEWQSKAAALARAEGAAERHETRLRELEDEMAIATLSEAIAREPMTAAHFRERAEALLRYKPAPKPFDDPPLTKPSMADRLFRRGRGDGSAAKALADCDTAILLDPGDARAYYLRAQARSTDFVKAIDDLSEAIRLDPAFAAAYGARGRRWYQNAMLTAVFSPAEVARTQFTQAVADLSEAVRLSRADASLLHDRGLAWLELHEYEKALADIDQAMALAPGDMEYQMSRADTLKARGDLDLAIKAYGGVIERDDKNRDARERRGDLFLKTKNYDRALADFAAIGLRYKKQEVLKAASRFGELIDDLCDELAASPDGGGTLAIYNELAWLHATCPDVQYREGKKAIEYAKKAIELTLSLNPQVCSTMAAACAEAGDFDEAVKWQTKAIECVKDLPPNQEWLRRLDLYKRGERYSPAATADEVRQPTAPNAEGKP